jgi:hypothetical protein
MSGNTKQHTRVDASDDPVTSPAPKLDPEQTRAKFTWAVFVLMAIAATAYVTMSAFAGDGASAAKEVLAYLFGLASAHSRFWLSD